MTHLLRISIEVEIRHHLPWMLTGNGTTHPQHLTGQHPPHQTHRVRTLHTHTNYSTAQHRPFLTGLRIHPKRGHGAWPHTLLLQGMAISTYLSGESVLHRAMVGMFTYEASVSGWWSARGSVTIRRRGSLKAA